MSTVLWVLQIVLALAFLAAGTMKLVRTQDQLRPAMGWVDDFSPTMVKVIGTLEILGALGLVLPAALDVAPILTPLAAVGLALVMVGALVTHARRQETAALPPPAVLLALSLVVAWGRFGPYAV